MLKKRKLGEKKMRTKPFKYKNEQGNEEVLHLRSLGTEYLGEIWEVANKLKPKKITDDSGKKRLQTEEEISDNVDKESINSLSKLCKLTVQKSTNWKEEQIDDFVSEYFWELMGEVLAFNLSPKGA